MTSALIEVEERDGGGHLKATYVQSRTTGQKSETRLDVIVSGAFRRRPVSAHAGTVAARTKLQPMAQPHERLPSGRLSAQRDQGLP